MSVIVQKYGGTSVGDIRRLKRVARRIARQSRRGDRVVVVVSAMGDSTDKLIDLAHQANPEPSEREMDQLISTGEQMSAALLTMALHHLGLDAVSLTGNQVGIITDNSHSKARILKISPRKIRARLSRGEVVVVAGFQGIDLKEDITTLGRGGSDTTAVALAAILKAEVCEIFTDVDGVYTADPRIVSAARKLDRISYDEMLEMASLGAKVLQSRAVEFAKKFSVTLHIRSSFTDKPGTIVSEEVENMSMEKVVIRGVALNRDEAKLTISRVPDRPGIAAGIFKAIARKKINVDMIIQNVSEKGFTDLSFTVPTEDLSQAKRIVKEVSLQIKSGDIRADEDIAKVSVVGVGMKSHPGVAATMFEAFARNKINIMMISTSEIKISCVVAAKDGEKASRVIHQAFGLG